MPVRGFTIEMLYDWCSQYATDGSTLPSECFSLNQGLCIPRRWLEPKNVPLLVNLVNKHVLSVGRHDALRKFGGACRSDIFDLIEMPETSIFWPMLLISCSNQFFCSEPPRMSNEQVFCEILRHALARTNISAQWLDDLMHLWDNPLKGYLDWPEIMTAAIRTENPSIVQWAILHGFTVPHEMLSEMARLFGRTSFPDEI